MIVGPSRRILAAALVLPLVLPACGEKAAPDKPQMATTAAPSAAPSASATATATASEPATSSATASAAPSAEPSAQPSSSAVASASATAAPSSKPHHSHHTTPATPATGSAAASAAPSASASATAAEIAPPAEGSADAIAQKVDAIFAPKKDFTAKFKQKLEQKVSGTKKEASGTLFIERPNKVSFRYDAPNQNRMVSDGKTFKAYVAEDKQMFESKVGSSSYAGGLAFFMDGLLKTMSFTFNTKADYKDGYVLIGKPRSPSPAYDMVMFYVSKAALEKGDASCIERIVIVDSQGNKNRFDFSEASFPASIAATEWEFTPPADTHIVKN
jgi:outer membrane lipoprotein carrier protein